MDSSLVTRGVKRAAFWLWPPLQAWVADRVIGPVDDLRGIDRRFREAVLAIREQLEGSLDEAHLEEMAVEVVEEESGRLETIEGKALTFLVSVAVSLGILPIIPRLLSESWGIPKCAAIGSGILLGVAIVHLLTAARYVVRARRIEGLALPTVDGVIEAIRTGETGRSERAVRSLARAKANEPALRRKANHAFVAETLFERGLTLVTISALVAVSAKLIDS